MRKILLVVSILALSIGLVYARDISATTDICKAPAPIKSPVSGPTDLNIRYNIEWTITIDHIAALGVTPVCIGTYPEGDTLLWVSSGGRTSSADPNWMLIYNLRTRTLVDSFLQGTPETWGYRDMCFYSGYVYAGYEGYLDKIDPVTKAVVGHYVVSTPNPVRALADNNVEDTVWTSNFTVPIYKLWNQGGAGRQVAPALFALYGLAYDGFGYMWGFSQNPMSTISKYTYPSFASYDSCQITEIINPVGDSAIAGGCEMWRDSFLLILGQARPLDKVYCLRVYFPPVNNDVGVRTILAPTGIINPRTTTTTPVRALIENTGINNQTSFGVRCTIWGPGHTQEYVDSRTISLNAGDTVTVSFNTWTPAVFGLCSVVVRTTLTDDYPANDRKVVTVTVAQSAMTGGPDAGMYWWKDSDAPGGPTYSWIDISTSYDDTCRTGDIQYRAGMPLGFTFNFYDKPRTTFSFSSNGFISLDALTAAYDANATIPSSAVPNNLICPFWDDLFTLGSWHKTVASPTDTYKIIQWRARSYYANYDSVNFQVILKKNGDIIFQYNRCDAGNYGLGQSATVGIEDSTGTIGLRYLYNDTLQGNRLAAGRAIRFYKQVFDNDIGMMQILSPTTQHVVGTQMTPKAKVKNVGNYAQTDFAVICSIVNPSGILRHTDTRTISLAAGRETTVTFTSWTPNTMELDTVKMRVKLVGDENTANDRIVQLTDISNTISIGTGTSASGAYVLYRYYRYSVSEQIYLQSEISFSGNITDLAYYKNSGTDVTPIESVVIFMKHTSAATLATGAWDTTGYTCVFAGAFTNNAASGWMNVTLTAPFQYNNVDNLQILVLKGGGPNVTTGYPMWRYTTTSPDYRLRYSNLATLPTSLTQSYYRPNIRFTVLPLSANDVGVISIFAPLTTHAVNLSMTPSANIKNFGTSAQSNFKVYCKIVGPASVVRYSDSVIVASLAAGVMDTVDFPTWNYPSVAELETVKIWTALAGDEYPANDLKTRITNVVAYYDAAVTAIIRPSATKESETKRVPFTPEVTVTNNGSYSADVPVIAEVWNAAQGISEGFEGTTFPPAGWVRYNNDGGTYQWDRNTSYPRTGAAHASCHYETSTLRNDDWLISPQIMVPPSGQLRFWYRTSTALTPYDSLHVRLSTTGNAIPDFTVLLDNFNILNTTYLERVIDLSAYANQSVYIAFVDVGLYAWTLCIDDVYLAYTPPALVYRDSILLVNVPSGTDYDTTVTFRACTLMTEGNYQFKSYTKLTGDMAPANDMMTRGFSVLPVTLTLTSPSNGVTTGDNTPTFSWNEVTEADMYRIEVDNNADFLSPEFAGTLGDLEIDSDPLLDGLYYWHVRVESPGTPDPYSAVWTLTVDTQGPVPPVLVLPEDGATLETATPTFTWEAVGDAVLYNLVVDDGTKDEVINIETSELTYTPTTGLDEGSFTWTVRAKDAVENWGLPSAPWSFSISLGTPGWASVESVPATLDLKAGKYVKDGGSMIGVGGAKDGDDIYMFPGNKSWYFYKYTRGTPGIFTTLESIPYGFKPTDPTKYNKKKIGKGAALCYDGTGIIYATKGNGTTELWAYDILANTWTQKAFVPVPKALKGGTSLSYYGGKLYLLAGGQKKTDLNNFYVYDPAGDTALGTPWTPLASLTLGANIKVWKDGASLAELGGVIYALKTNDKANLFYGYDILGIVWNPVDSMPVVESLFGKSKKVIAKDGAAMVSGGGSIYAIKGGGANVFWKFNGVAWSKLESIPRLHKKSVAKTGAALAYANNRVYLMKGNNSPEFWCYTRSALNATRLTPTTVVSTMVEKTNLTNVFSFNVAPNPFNRTTIIRYTVPVAGKVSVKLYSTSGRVVETVNNSYLNAGNYTTTLNANTLASGVYFLRYEDRTNRAEIKLIVE